MDNTREIAKDWKVKLIPSFLSNNEFVLNLIDSVYYFFKEVLEVVVRDFTDRDEPSKILNETVRNALKDVGFQKYPKESKYVESYIHLNKIYRTFFKIIQVKGAVDSYKYLQYLFDLVLNVYPTLKVMNDEYSIWEDWLKVGSISDIKDYQLDSNPVRKLDDGITRLDFSYFFRSVSRRFIVSFSRKVFENELEEGDHVVYYKNLFISGEKLGFEKWYLDKKVKTKVLTNAKDITENVYVERWQFYIDRDRMSFVDYFSINKHFISNGTMNSLNWFVNELKKANEIPYFEYVLDLTIKDQILDRMVKRWQDAQKTWEEILPKKEEDVKAPKNLRLDYDKWTLDQFVYTKKRKINPDYTIEYKEKKEAYFKINKKEMWLLENGKIVVSKKSEYDHIGYVYVLCDDFKKLKKDWFYIELGIGEYPLLEKVVTCSSRVNLIPKYDINRLYEDEDEIHLRMKIFKDNHISSFRELAILDLNKSPLLYAKFPTINFNRFQLSTLYLKLKNEKKS